MTLFTMLAKHGENALVAEFGPIASNQTTGAQTLDKQPHIAFSGTSRNPHLKKICMVKSNNLRRWIDRNGLMTFWKREIGMGTVHDQGGSKTLIRKDGNLLLVALDWVKAFDSISPAGLVKAMSRFGIPYHFCSVARGIYKWRRNFSPAPPMLWHFPRLSFITFSVLDCHDDAHSKCEGYLPFEKGPSQNRRNQRIDVDMGMTP